MKIAAPVAVAALALVVAGAALFRSPRGPEGVSAGAPSPAAETDTSSPPSLTPVVSDPYATEPTAPAAPSVPGVASRLSEILMKAKRLVEANRASGVPLSEFERTRLRLLQGNATRLGAELDGLLRQDPAAWPALLDRLAALEDVNVAVQMMDLISGAVDGAAETLLAERLRSGKTYGARRTALAALSHRESMASGSALILAAEADEDPRIRLAALTALARRRNSDAASGLAATIEDVIRRRAGDDPEEGVRQAARDLLPETAARVPPPPPPRSGWSLDLRNAPGKQPDGGGR